MMLANNFVTLLTEEGIDLSINTVDVKINKETFILVGIKASIFEDALFHPRLLQLPRLKDESKIKRKNSGNKDVNISVVITYSYPINLSN